MKNKFLRVNPRAWEKGRKKDFISPMLLDLVQRLLGCGFYGSYSSSKHLHYQQFFRLWRHSFIRWNKWIPNLRSYRYITHFILVLVQPNYRLKLSLKQILALHNSIYRPKAGTGCKVIITLERYAYREHFWAGFIKFGGHHFKGLTNMNWASWPNSNSNNNLFRLLTFQKKKKWFRSLQLEVLPNFLIHKTFHWLNLQAIVSWHVEQV